MLPGSVLRFASLGLPLLTLWLCGCKSDTVSEKEAAFWKQLEERRQLISKDHPQAAGPTGSATLRWDLSGQKSWTYDYTHEQKDLGAPMVGAAAVLAVSSQGDGTAHVALKDPVSMARGDESAPPLQPVTVQGMKDDGRMEVGDTLPERFLMLLFALPEGPLAVGKPVEAPATLPFTVGGGTVSAAGAAKTVLTGYVEIDGRTCARIDTRLEVPDTDVAGKDGTYTCGASVRLISYFDIQDRGLVSAHLKLEMATAAKEPLPPTRRPTAALVNLTRKR